MSEAYPEMLSGSRDSPENRAGGCGDRGGCGIYCKSRAESRRSYATARKKGIPVYPGVATASEIEQALELGLSVVKFFPAEVNGGVKAIKALSGPYIQLRFMPTGGINADNIKDYLTCPQVIACGGSWMVRENLIEEKRFDKIEELCKEVVEQIR